MKEYQIVYEETDTGYSAFVVELPGCVATGATLDEVGQNIRDAIEFHLEGLEIVARRIEVNFVVWPSEVSTSGSPVAGEERNVECVTWTRELVA
jgi:predicted RNase H-like HicB family nuclease